MRTTCPDLPANFLPETRGASGGIDCRLFFASRKHFPPRRSNSPLIRRSHKHHTKLQTFLKPKARSVARASPPPSQQQSAVFHDGLPQGSEYRSDRRRPGSAAGPNGKGGRLLVRISREGPVRLHRYRRRRAACEGAFKVRKGEEEVEALPCTPSGLTCCCNAVVASRAFRGRSG